MPVSKTIVISLCLSGAVAGLAGMTEVAGIQHRLQPGISPGYGYTAIIVAWLARLNPWAMVVVSFLFGALLVGGELLQITMKVSAHLAMLIQGLVLFFVLAGDFVGRFRVRWIKEEK
jgi:simple sugar transport system permease protein